MVVKSSTSNYKSYLSFRGSVPEIWSLRPGPRTRTPHLVAMRSVSRNQGKASQDAHTWSTGISVPMLCGILEVHLVLGEARNLPVAWRKLILFHQSGLRLGREARVQVVEIAAQGRTQVFEVAVGPP